MSDAQGAYSFHQQWTDSFPASADLPSLDLVSIKHLQLPNGVLCSDIWGQTKQQPATIDVELRLSAGLQSAASGDTLDSSTIHYGKLSKQIRSALEGALNIAETLDRVDHEISALAMPTGEPPSAVSLARMTIKLPKASTHGDGYRIVDCRTFDNLERPGKLSLSLRIFTFDELKIMALVGVNAVERTAPQALVVTCSFFLSGNDYAAANEGMKAASQYERTLVEHVQKTSFETLEALAEYLHVKIHLDTKTWPAILGLRLKLEKPSALLYADAPAIEIIRLFRA